MADEAKTPAKTPADGAGRADKAPGDGTNDQIAKMLADLAAQVTTLATAQAKTDTGLRSLVDKQVGSLRRELESLRGGGEPTNPPAQEDLRLAALEKKVNENSRDTRMARFFQDFPEARDHWNEIMSVMEDENQAALVASRREDGSLDFYGSYANALNRVLASKFRAAKAAGDQAAIKAKEEQAKQRAQADLGGGAGLESIPENLTLADVEKMTPKQMEDMGLTKLFPGLYA